MAACFTESLNVSVAAAIVLQEARQQRLRALGRCWLLLLPVLAPSGWLA
jgi:hypothetical protein